MSYDLLAFDGSHAPGEPEAFKRWCRELMSGERGAGPTPALAAWLAEMEVRYRTLREDGWIGAHVIQAGFAWTEARAALEFSLEAAARHQVGLYDPQEDRRWLPAGEGRLDPVSPTRAESKPDAAPVARALLADLRASGDIEAEADGDWADLERRVTEVLDKARHRSAAGDLEEVLLDHPAVAEFFPSRGQLKHRLDDVAERVLGRPPKSTTGWV